MDRKRVGLVLGDFPNLSVAQIFEPLSLDFDVSVYILGEVNSLSKVPAIFEKFFFECDQSIPGYMQGLESRLKNLDLIICINIGSFSSLQASRTAIEFKIPLVCYVLDYDIYAYRDYINLKMALQIMISHAVLFFVPSVASKNELICLGVNQDRIKLLFPWIDPIKNSALEDKRTKFRRYIGLSKEHRVVLFYGCLLKSSNPQIILQALKLLGSINPTEALRSRVIFCGKGDDIDELKLFSQRMGLGKHTFFITQNPEPFFHDLLSASDYIVVPKDENNKIIRHYPIYLVEAVMAGVIPIIGEGNIFLDIFKSMKYKWNGTSYEHLALVFDDTSRNIVNKRKIVCKLQEEMRRSLDSDNRRKHLLAISTLVQQASKLKPVIPWDLWERQAKCYDKADDVMRSIRKVENTELSNSERSRMLVMKGSICTLKGKLELAKDNFEFALEYDSGNSSALFGLGNIALLCYSHEEAMSLFKRCLALNPYNDDCLLGVALVYKRLGMIEDSIYWSERAITLGATGKTALQALIQACSECSDVFYAIAAVERAIEIVGDDAVLMRGLGQLYLKSGFIKVGYEILDKYLTPIVPTGKKN